MLATRFFCVFFFSFFCVFFQDLSGWEHSESESRSVVSDSLPPHGLYCPWNSPGQNTGVGSLSLLQGIFPTQRLHPGPLHCRQTLYQLSHKGSHSKQPSNHGAAHPSLKMSLYLPSPLPHDPPQGSRWSCQLYHLTQPIPKLISYRPNPFSALIPSGTTNASGFQETNFQAAHYSGSSCLSSPPLGHRLVSSVCDSSF